MCYRSVKGRTRYEQRSFHGEPIGIDHLNYGRPRICPSCLRERPVWWAVWDLALVTACPMHRGLLVNHCPACKRTLAWYRPAVHECRCGFDFRALSADGANDELVMINAAIYRASGFQCGAAVEKESNRYHFPPEMARLGLSSLLSLVQFVGCAGGNGMSRWKQRRLASTDLAAVTDIGMTAAVVLRDWPRQLREVLRRMMPGQVESVADVNFRDVFGNFYRHLLRVLPRADFGFLQDAFEEFIVEDWNDVVRHKCLRLRNQEIRTRR
jgi:hypothetical protein